MKHITAAQSEILHSITCDVCKKKFDGADWMEVQEFVKFSDCAGYGARHYEDGDVYEIDICQDCFANMLKPFSRIIRPSPY